MNKTTSKAEVLTISPFGLWILILGKENYLQVVNALVGGYSKTHSYNQKDACILNLKIILKNIPLL